MRLVPGHSLGGENQEAVKCLLGGVTPSIFLKLQESWSKGGHAAREMVTVYFVNFFIINSCKALSLDQHQ